MYKIVSPLLLFLLISLVLPKVVFAGQELQSTPEFSSYIKIAWITIAFLLFLIMIPINSLFVFLVLKLFNLEIETRKLLIAAIITTAISLIVYSLYYLFALPNTSNLISNEAINRMLSEEDVRFYLYLLLNPITLAGLIITYFANLYFIRRFLVPQKHLKKISFVFSLIELPLIGLYIANGLTQIYFLIFSFSGHKFLDY